MFDCIELDGLHHGPNWAEATAEELQARVQDALDDEAGWVVDGNYHAKLSTLLWDRADLIVWLDLPFSTKLKRLTWRTVRRVLTREVLWNGNRESLKGAFWGRDSLFAWTIRMHFRHRGEWPQQLSGRHVVRLETPKEVAQWLAAFARDAPPPSD